MLATQPGNQLTAVRRWSGCTLLLHSPAGPACTYKNEVCIMGQSLAPLNARPFHDCSSVAQFNLPLPTNHPDSLVQNSGLFITLSQTPTSSMTGCQAVEDPTQFCVDGCFQVARIPQTHAFPPRSDTVAAAVAHHMAPVLPAQAGKLGLGQQLYLRQGVPLSRQPVRQCAHRACGLPLTHPTFASSSGHSSRPSSRRGVISHAVAAPPPEFLLEKGGPGATYGNGAVAKVRRGLRL